MNEETGEETADVRPGTLSYCELLAQQGEGDQVGEATVFVSHAWKYGFSEAVSALESKFGGMGTKLLFDIAMVSLYLLLSAVLAAGADNMGAGERALADGRAGGRLGEHLQVRRGDHR